MSPNANKPQVSPETLNTARATVRQLLESSPAYAELPEDKRKQLARDLVQVSAFLAEPGMRVAPQHMSRDVLALAQAAPGPSRVKDTGSSLVKDQPAFGTAVRAGVEQAVALIQGVNFPGFVSGLIEGVFHSIVKSSIEQMEAYGKLVADVSKSLNQFRDDNTTANQGRDHLVEQFPDIFQLQMPGEDDAFGGGFGDAAPTGPRVSLREGVDERTAMARVNATLPLDKPITKIDDELVEALLVPAAQTQLATGRQQLLATMVMMGINRIVVTDGKIQAKVMFEFQAKDNRRYQASATQFDYATDGPDGTGTIQKTRGYEGEYDYGSKGGSYSRDKDGSVSSDSAGYYSKGSYKYSEKPIIKAMSTSHLADDSSLQSKASLLGNVEVNFKSDYLPLEKMATPENIAAIQMNAQPGMVKTMAGRPQRPAAPAPTPAAAPAPATAAPAPAAA